MNVNRVVARLQDQDDVSVSLGAGEDGKHVAYQNSSGKFVLAAVASGNGYTLQGGCSKISPADSTTYYLGPNIGEVPVTTADLYRAYIPKSGTVKAIYVFAYTNGTNGTTENVSAYFRLKNTTDVLIATGPMGPTDTDLLSNTGLSQAVSAGDYFQIKLVFPAWATNPTNVYWSYVVYIE